MVCAPGLELLIIAAPAEVAARGPAPQEGLQLVDRRPLCAPPPPPLLPTLVLRLVPALLPPALLLHGLLFLLGGGGVQRHPGAGRAGPALPRGTREGSGSVCTSLPFFFFFFFSFEGGLPSLSARMRRSLSSPWTRGQALPGPPGLV